MPRGGRALLLGAALALCLGRAAALVFDACAPLEPLRKGRDAAFVVGLAFWPGSVPSDWGDAATGAQPCNARHRAMLAERGVRFAVFNVRADKLSVLKTGGEDQAALARAAAAAGGGSGGGTPRVVTAIAFRGDVRSDAAIVSSADANATGGVGTAATLSLMAKFEHGALKYLQFYNLTCNDCGGAGSALCLNGTTCALPAAACRCVGGDSSDISGDSGSSASGGSSAGGEGSGGSTSDGGGGGSHAASAGDGSSPTHQRRLHQQQQDGASDGPAGSCNSTAAALLCSPSVNIAFDGVDAAGAAFTSAAQVRKLNSYSLVALFARGKGLALDLKAKYIDGALAGYASQLSAGLGEARREVAAAFNSTAQEQAGRSTGSAPSAS